MAVSEEVSFADNRYIIGEIHEAMFRPHREDIYKHGTGEAQ